MKRMTLFGYVAVVAAMVFAPMMAHAMPEPIPIESAVVVQAEVLPVFDHAIVSTTERYDKPVDHDTLALAHIDVPAFAHIDPGRT